MLVRVVTHPAADDTSFWDFPRDLRQTSDACLPKHVLKCHSEQEKSVNLLEISKRTRLQLNGKGASKAKRQKGCCMNRLLQS